MKILFIQPRVGIGDFILFLPFIRAIAANEKDSEIYILTKKRAAADQILLHEKNIKIIFIESALNTERKQNAIKEFFNLKNLIKSYSFEKVFILHQSCRYALLCKLAGIKKIFGYGRNFQFLFLSPLSFNKYFFNKNFSIYDEAFKFTKKIINNKEFDKNAEIIVANKEREDLNLKYKFDKEKNIIIGIGGSGPTVKWPIKNWMVLIDYLNKNFNTNFLIAGGKNEEENFSLIQKNLNIKNIFSLCNLSIRDALIAMSFGNFFIGNDSGMHHIAAALKINTLVLVGSTPLNYTKYSTFMNQIIPDGYQDVGHSSDAMKYISVQNVIKKFENINSVKKFI
jgi:heptosyltransferase-2